MQVSCYRPRGMEGVRPPDSPGELPTLGRATFVSGTGDLGVKDVHAIGLQVSDCIGTEVQVHLLALIYAPYAKWAHKKRLE